MFDRNATYAIGDIFLKVDGEVKKDDCRGRKLIRGAGKGQTCGSVVGLYARAVHRPQKTSQKCKFKGATKTLIASVQHK